MNHDEIDETSQAILDAGGDPNEFEFIPEDPSLSGAPDFPAVRRITVRNRKTGKVREYHEGGGSDWSIVFGADLVTGVFDRAERPLMGLPAAALAGGSWWSVAGRA